MSPGEFGTPGESQCLPCGFRALSHRMARSRVSPTYYLSLYNFILLIFFGIFRTFDRPFQLEHAAKISDNFRITKFFIDYFRIMCKILSRIKLLADSEGISIGTIERTIGASRGVISKAIAKGTDIQAKWLELICEKYPTYSPTWLLTGQGSMYSGEISDTPKVTHSKIITPTTMEPTAEYSQSSSDPIVDRFMSQLMHQAEEIGRLKARIEQLERELEDANTPPDTAEPLQAIHPKVLKGT